MRSEVANVTDLAKRLGCGNSEHIALVGGGGKTTSLFAVARGLTGSVVATTTTRMSTRRTGGLRTIIDPTDDELVEALRANSQVLTWNALDGPKAIGVSPERCDTWFGLWAVDHVVVESDGARRRPFTAPMEFEPVIPVTATIVVACIGANALGRVIADQCHRPMRVAAAAKCSPYQRLTPERAATALLSERGSRKSVPPSARFAIAIHGVNRDNETLAAELVAAIPASRVSAVVQVAETGPKIQGW